MAESLLTPFDYAKRKELHKLIGKREILYQLELHFCKNIAEFKKLFFDKREFDYYALSVPDPIQDRFIQLWLKLSYRRNILDSEHERVSKDFIKLDLGKYQFHKNASSLLLTNKNVLNPSLSAAHVNGLVPTLNRPKDIIGNDIGSQRCFQFVNFLRDISDINDYYIILGDPENLPYFERYVKALNANILKGHKQLQRDYISQVFKNPNYNEYLEFLLHNLRGNDIIDDAELSYYMNNLLVRGYEKDSGEKYKVLQLKKQKYLHVANSVGSGFDIGKAHFYYDPVQTQIGIKTDDNHLENLNAIKNDPFHGMSLSKMSLDETADSLNHLEKKQDLLLAIQKMKKAKVLNEEQKWKADNLEKITQNVYNLEQSQQNEKVDETLKNIGSDKTKSRTSKTTIATSKDGKASDKKTPSRRSDAKTTTKKTSERVSSKDKKPSSRDKKPPTKETKPSTRDKKPPVRDKKAPSKSTDKKAPSKSTDKKKTTTRKK